MAQLSVKDTVGRILKATTRTNVRTAPNRTAASKILFVANPGQRVGLVVGYVPPIPGKVNAYWKISIPNKNNPSKPITGYLDSSIAYISDKLSIAETNYFAAILSILRGGINNPYLTASGAATASQSAQTTAAQAEELVDETGAVIKKFGSGVLNIASWTKWLLIGGAGLLIFKFVNNGTNFRYSK